MIPSFVGGALILLSLIGLHYALSGNLKGLELKPYSQLIAQGGQPGATRLE